MEAFIIIIVALMVIGVVASITSKGASGNLFRQAADRLGLHFKGGDMLANPEILGTLHGCRVSVQGKREGTSIASVQYRVGYPQALGFDFKITRSSTYSGHSDFIGAPPVKTGDDEFDKAVLVKGRDADLIRTLLTAPRRRRIARFLSVLPGAVVEHSQLTWRQREVPKHADEIIAAVERMVRLAGDLSGYHVRQLDSPPAATAAPPLPPREVLERVSKDDTWLVKLELGPAVEHSETEPPERQDEQPAFVNGTPAADTSPAAERHADGRLTIDVVCNALFDPTVSASDAARQFDSLFKDKDVAWSGTLTSLASYPFDRVFGSDRGAKATVSVCEASERYGARAVQAVIRLPPQGVADLRTLVGRTVDFQGTLLQCDHFMRSLYLRDGRIRAVTGDPA